MIRNQQVIDVFIVYLHIGYAHKKFPIHILKDRKIQNILKQDQF